jgi:hypothetical protein
MVSDHEAYQGGVSILIVDARHAPSNHTGRSSELPFAAAEGSAIVQLGVEREIPGMLSFYVLLLCH